MLTSIFETTTMSTMTIPQAIICMIAAMILGLIISVTYSVCEEASKNFLVTLVVLPVLVQAVIIMVNGNLGTGIAVAGTFGLVRFRSWPGSAREIGTVFFAMAAGLACGMGQLLYAGILTVLVAVIFIALHFLHFGEKKQGHLKLRIQIPENLDYTTVFDDIFTEFTDSRTLMRAKTTNMGTMYELTYRIAMKDEKRQKEMIDAIRCRNGNLMVVCGREIVDEQTSI